MTGVLVLGGTGMLGHKVWQECSERFDDAWATIRGDRLAPDAASMLDPARAVPGVRAEDAASVGKALDRTGADVAINCIGVVKQSATVGEPAAAVRLNALFPHEVAIECSRRGVRMIHISTDCVFSGEKGGYRESDAPDARDLYGRSKLLGEVTADGCITLRTSIVGRELAHSRGLLEWFIAQRGGSVPGFSRAVFSGMTTRALARELATAATDSPALTGIWHAGGDPITKHDLLVLVRDALALDVEIVPDATVVIDRSLDSERFRSATGRTPPAWPEMIEDLLHDPTPYDLIRR